MSTAPVLVVYVSEHSSTTEIGATCPDTERFGELAELLGEPVVPAARRAGWAEVDA